MPPGPRPAGASRTNRSSADATTRPVSSAGDASGLLQTMQTHVDDLRSHLVCGICIRPLYEPFTIACGHTFCYSCLSAWFGSNTSCPDCRSPVKAQPAPAYLIRTLVHIFTSRPELLETEETTANHLKLQREEAQRLERDKTNTDPRTGGLFKGKFKPKPPVQKPVLDLEDNVYRCPQCSWELEEDSGCVRCGYHPDDASVASSETGAGESDPEDNSEMSDYLDDEAEDGFDDADDLGWNAFGVPAAALPHNLQDHLHGMRDIFDYDHRRIRSLRPGGRAPGRLSDYEEDDDEDDMDDMDSFIEDDINGERGHGSESTVVGGHEPSTQDHYDESPHSTEASMSDDTSNSLEGDDSMSETDEDDNEDDGEDRIQPPPSHRMPQFNGYGSRFSRPFQSSAHLYCTARLPPSNAGSSAHVAIDIDDESDDDEGPVDPVRRARGRRDHGFSAY